MAIKVLIRRNVPIDKAREIIPLFRKMRSLATIQQGYISGETLKSLDRPNIFLVISNWKSSDDWEKWLLSKDRQFKKKSMRYWAVKRNTKYFTTVFRNDESTCVV